MFLFNTITGIAMLYALSIVYKTNIELHTRSTKLWHENAMMNKNKSMENHLVSGSDVNDDGGGGGGGNSSEFT